MWIVGTPEAENTKNKIEAHSMVGVYKSCVCGGMQKVFRRWDKLKNSLRKDNINIRWIKNLLFSC